MNGLSEALKRFTEATQQVYSNDCYPSVNQGKTAKIDIRAEVNPSPDQLGAFVGRRKLFA
jgi:hypothetical protein